MSKLYTIGYEGSDIDRFIQTLEIIGIELVADVRELPLSRKKGFSKNGLRDALEARGIEYTHFKNLGDPKAGREAARSGKFREFRKIFRSHFESEVAQNSFDDLLEISRSKLTCMLCFERCATNCHRLIIADQAAIMGVEIYNLISDDPERYIGNVEKIPRYNSSKSLSPAE